MVGTVLSLALSVFGMGFLKGRKKIKTSKQASSATPLNQTLAAVETHTKAELNKIEEKAKQELNEIEELGAAASTLDDPADAITDLLKSRKR